MHCASDDADELWVAHSPLSWRVFMVAASGDRYIKRDFSQLSVCFSRFTLYRLR